MKENTFDSATRNQLRRSSLSIVLNIAEGTGRKTRGSVFECIAIFDLLKDKGLISKEVFQSLYFKSEELSKMLYAMQKV